METDRQHKESRIGACCSPLRAGRDLLDMQSPGSLASKCLRRAELWAAGEGVAGNVHTLGKLGVHEACPDVLLPCAGAQTEKVS